MMSDPYYHHPELRSQIADPHTSFFRSFTTEVLAKKAQEYGAPKWWYSDETREALRSTALSVHRHQDLWVFVYGSLMWDPAFDFAEVRRANVPNYARRFILKDIYGGRGNAETPGLMAALDYGSGCDGLLFRIERDRIEEETEVLWRREQVGPVYKSAFVEAHVEERPIHALTFVADHQADLIDDTLTRDEQIRFIATGVGFLGSSIDYLRNIQERLALLGIHDEEVEALLRDAETYSSAH
jgi:cation transport protein ChaC